MNREKQLETAVIDLSIMLVSIMRMVWDFIPRTLAGNILRETEKKLELTDENKTKTIRNDIELIKSYMNKEGK